MNLQKSVIFERQKFLEYGKSSHSLEHESFIIYLFFSNYSAATFSICTFYFKIIESHVYSCHL